MTEPPTFWQTITRQLAAWGHRGPIRRALERVGLVRREETLDEFVRRHHAAGRRIEVRIAPFSSHQWADLESERSKQIPDVWQAADRAERGGK